MIAKIFLTVLGLFYVATGLWCGVRPRQTMEAIGLSTLNGSGSSEYVTVYGGFLVGVGIFLAVAGMNPSYVMAGLVASTAIHAGIIVARGISLGVYSDIKPITYGLATFEAVIFVASAILVWMSRVDGSPVKSNISQRPFDSCEICMTESGRRSGCFLFIFLMTVGFISTRLIVEWLLADLPRDDVPEALYRDGFAVGYTILGWIVTFAISTAAALRWSRS